MDIILHPGAHRTASTAYQAYLRGNTAALLAQGCGFWGPLRTRKGLLHGLGQPPRTAADRKTAERAAGRVRVNLARARMSGLRHLIVSDENMLGNMRRCLSARRLYHDVGERMARFGVAFGPVTRVHLTIRNQADWWSSVLACMVARGVAVPHPETLDRIAGASRTWRDVVLDLACALPGADIVVTPFEAAAGRPDRVFTIATGETAPRAGRNVWVNRAPRRDDLRRLVDERGEAPRLALPPGPGRWRPFDAAQTAALREAWADDIHWLRAGADGLARIVDHTDAGSTGAGMHVTGHSHMDAPPLRRAATGSRGQPHDPSQGHLG